VTSIQKEGVMVLVPRYGLEGMVYFSDEDTRLNEQLWSQEAGIIYVFNLYC